MPVAKIQLADGRIARFEVPEGTTPDQVTAFAQQQFSQAKPESPSYMDSINKARSDMSPVGENLKNLAYGATKGAADLVQGFGQIVMNGSAALSGDGPAGRYVKQKATQFNDYLRNQEAQYQADTPGSAAAGIGRVSAGVAPFLASGGSSAAPQAANALAKMPLIPQIIGGSIRGGSIGALQPVNDVEQGADGSDNFLQQKGLQAGISATAGAAAVPVGNALARLISPNTRPEVSKLLQEGVTPTPGQILGGGFARTEEKLSSLPLVGDMIKNAQRRAVDDLNIAAYNRALAPIGEKASGKVGREGVEEVKAKLGKAYDDLLPKMQFRADQQFSAEIGNLTGMIQNGNVPPEISRQFNSILKNEVLSRMTKQGTMDGQAFKELETKLGQEIKRFGKSQDPNHQAISDALSEVLSSARGVLTRANPQYADQLAKINEGYANYARIRSAASGLGAEDGAFTAAQLQNAVKANDKSVGKGKFATGNALMQDLSESAKSVIGSKYPDSGTAGRLAIPIASSGGAALAVTNPLLAAGAIGMGGLAVAPYTALGQRMAAAALAKRPAIAAPIANGVRAVSPILGAAGSPLLPQFMPQGAN